MISPENGTRLLRDPESPRELATLALETVVKPPAKQVVWYGDGVTFRVVDYSYAARWPLEPGEHMLEARVPAMDAGSAEVRLSVQ